MSPNENPTKQQDNNEDQLDLSSEFYNFGESFDPLQHQQLQQYKLLEFQQTTKRKQGLPLEDCRVRFPKSAIERRLLALKQLQEKQRYEHQLQQQYENRSIIENSCASDLTDTTLPLHENAVIDDFEEPFFCSDNMSRFPPEISERRCLETDSISSFIHDASESNIESEVEAVTTEFYNTISSPSAGKEFSDFEDENRTNISKELESSNDYEHNELNEENTNISKSRESLASSRVQDVNSKTGEDEFENDSETHRLIRRHSNPELQQELFVDNQV